MDTVIELEAPHAQHSASLSSVRSRLRSFFRTGRSGKQATSMALLQKASAVKSLGDLAKGESGTIARIHGATSVRLHLMEMGLTPGTRITVGRVAVLGGPFDVTIRGYRLSLRREEARAIELRAE